MLFCAVGSKKWGKVLQYKKKRHTFAHGLSPDGGIGRRVGLKHQYRKVCRFDPGSGYRKWRSRHVSPLFLHFLAVGLVLSELSHSVFCNDFNLFGRNIFLVCLVIVKVFVNLHRTKYAKTLSYANKHPKHNENNHQYPWRFGYFC